MMGSDTWAPAPALYPIALEDDVHSTDNCGPKPCVAGGSGMGIVNDASPESVTENSRGVEPTMLYDERKQNYVSSVRKEGPSGLVHTY